MQAADLLELRDDLEGRTNKNTAEWVKLVVMTSFQQLRQQRHNQFITELKSRLQRLISKDTTHPKPDQIYLFGSRARGDWDGHSDTDLLVVAATRQLADQWVDGCWMPGWVPMWWGLIRRAGGSCRSTPT